MLTKDVSRETVLIKVQEAFLARYAAAAKKDFEGHSLEVLRDVEIIRNLMHIRAVTHITTVREACLCSPFTRIGLYFKSMRDSEFAVWRYLFYIFAEKRKYLVDGRPLEITIKDYNNLRTAVELYCVDKNQDDFLAGIRKDAKKVPIHMAGKKDLGVFKPLEPDVSAGDDYVIFGGRATGPDMVVRASSALDTDKKPCPDSKAPTVRSHLETVTTPDKKDLRMVCDEKLASRGLRGIVLRNPLDYIGKGPGTAGGLSRPAALRNRGHTAAPMCTFSHEVETVSEGASLGIACGAGGKGSMSAAVPARMAGQVMVTPPMKYIGYTKKTPVKEFVPPALRRLSALSCSSK